MIKQTTTFLAAITIASAASAGISCINISSATQSSLANSGNDNQGNPSVGELLLDDEAFGGSDIFNLDLDWEVVGSSDDGGAGPFTSNPEVNIGTLTFDTPQTGPFVISIKSATFFSLYYFDASFGSVDCIDFDTFDTSEKNGKGRDLSHSTLYTAQGGNTPPTGIPSPTAALAGLGLLGLIVSRRRRG